LAFLGEVDNINLRRRCKVVDLAPPGQWWIVDRPPDRRPRGRRQSHSDDVHDSLALDPAALDHAKARCRPPTR
jgi:hypothetical protein